MIDQFVAPELVRFKAGDGMPITGFLYTPQAADGERARALVFAHGGSRRTWFPAFGLSLTYQRLHGFFQYLVQRGYAVLVVNYRSGTGHGLEFREAIGYGGGGATDVQDFIGAARFLAARDDVDPTSIAIMGWSYGGHLVTNALARAPDLYAAGISVAGVGDWVTEMNTDNEAYLDFNIPARFELERLAYESSAIAHIDRWRDPVMFIHGDDDDSAAMAQTIELAAALRQRGVPVETLIYPDESHGFELHESRVDLFQGAFDFLERRMPPEQ